jgi:hypothetical protein
MQPGSFQHLPASIATSRICCKMSCFKPAKDRYQMIPASERSRVAHHLRAMRRAKFKSPFRHDSMVEKS